jgi:MerR family transcriptional regulator, copper efflux regulator
MRMRELIKKTGLAERQVRFLVAQGFIPPPRGGRANADYGDDHVSAILRYTRLKELGFPPAAIRLLLDAKEGVPVTIEPGITLVIATEQLGENRDFSSLEKSVSSALQKIFNSPDQGQPANDQDD